MDAITNPEDSVLQEIDELRPQRRPVGLLSKNERLRLVERSFLGLYRWYVARSQETRNWNPDLTFNWREYRKDHSDEVHAVIEGYYAVEQYVPDYVTTLLKVIRQSYGRSHFHMRWGSEEEKHADLWRNAVLFGGKRSAAWVEEYGDTLRGQEWRLPWDDPMHMLFYTVFQERATQLNYVNLSLIAKGESQNPIFANDTDPVLVHASKVIAVDEAAHYNFFLEGARIFLYYFPAEATQAMVNVLRHFSMPAGNIIPNYDKFAEILHRTAIFGQRQFSRDVVKVALAQLGAESLRAVEEGIRRSREVPDELGATRRTSIFETLDFNFIEGRIKSMFGRIQAHERKAGLDLVEPTIFIANPDFSPSPA